MKQAWREDKEVCMSLPVRGRGLKLSWLLVFSHCLGRSPCGGVD